MPYFIFYLYSYSISDKTFYSIKKIYITHLFYQSYQKVFKYEKMTKMFTKMCDDIDRSICTSDNRSFCQFSTWFSWKVWIANNEAINTNGKEIGLEWRELFLHFFTIPFFYPHLPFCSVVSCQPVSSLSTTNDRYILFKVIVYLVILTDCFSIWCVRINSRISRI